VSECSRGKGEVWVCPVCNGEGALKEVLVGDEHLVLEPASVADADAQSCDTCNGLGQLNVVAERDE
jgi:RecJ-like exonuclease